jgi:6-phosphogluconolactonase
MALREGEKSMDASAGMKVRVQEDLEQSSRTVAERLVQIAASAIRERGRFCLNLSGGSTPRGLYGLLAGEFRNRIPWSRTHLFWGDERYVPWDDPQSNFRMAQETMISRVPIPAVNIHPVPVGETHVVAAAESYEKLLRDFFEKKEQPADATFDVTLLGMGEDGHTASLFPGSSALDEKTRRWAVAVKAPAGIEPSQRITMTLPVLNRSNFIFFLVSGVKKRTVAVSILKGKNSAAQYPSAMVRAGIEVVWYVDPSIIQQ